MVLICTVTVVTLAERWVLERCIPLDMCSALAVV